MQDPNLTPLSSLGEFGLIDRLTGAYKPSNPSTLKGIGDDAAVLDYPDRKVLISTDLLIEGVHFDLTYYPLKHLGYKAVAVNLSDIYAMNGTPEQITVSLAISSRFSLEAIEEIYSGIYLACQTYGVDLVGGDTTSSRIGLVISVTVVGSAPAGEIVYRSGAKENDLVCVSGDLGAAYAGLLILEREKSVFKADPSMQPELEGLDYLLQRQLKPEPRADIINDLRKAGVQPTAMIDVSDGVASDIRHIAKQSGLGCVIFEDKLPIFQTAYDQLAEMQIDPTTAALNGGEDYELLFTISQADYDKIKDHNDISIIGYMTTREEGYHLISKSGTKVELKAQGWDALKS
ncbi:MAG TPA: thiamine-phosphate kinase [Bacteroidales bacterium]|nr:thiamine-phosphate kinase [Bacteroidales bacterium]HRZ48159.1 thiamine-phosphate kinase [Bacteroidales bacterium]